MINKIMVQFVVLTMSILLAGQSSYAQDTLTSIKANGYTQSIQVINLLENNEINDPGMTPTPVLVRYYNGGANPCWTNKLNYQEDVIAHAGPGLGCKEKITHLVIEPALVADKLMTYGSSITIEVDSSKFATQVMVMQATAPVFNMKNGLVDQSGTIQAKIQSQLVE